MKKKVKDKYPELYSSDYSSFDKQSKPGSHTSTGISPSLSAGPLDEAWKRSH